MQCVECFRTLLRICLKSIYADSPSAADRATDAYDITSLYSSVPRFARIMILCDRRIRSRHNRFIFAFYNYCKVDCSYSTIRNVFVHVRIVTGLSIEKLSAKNRKHNQLPNNHLNCCTYVYRGCERVGLHANLYLWSMFSIRRNKNNQIRIIYAQ